MNTILLSEPIEESAIKLLEGKAQVVVSSDPSDANGLLDWLLVVWFWDPNYLYGIGWQNRTSMLFMIIMYALGAVICFGFSAYRKRQGIDVNKVYQNIPVE